MKNLFSIGEVSKIKGVSHRMLRHYDKIGILVPTLVNEETGYRYYSKSQMMILELIIICTDLGIPLKQINSYISEDGSYDTKKILEDGQKLADEKQKQLNKTVYKLDTMREHFERADNTLNGDRVKEIDKRYFITKLAINHDYSIEEYWRNLHELSNKSDKYNLSQSVNQGAVYIFFENGYEVRFFIEVAKPSKKLGKIEDLFVIPKGEFVCEIFEDDDYEKALEKYSKPYNAGSYLVIADVIEEKISHKILPFEVQLLSV